MLRIIQIYFLLFVFYSIAGWTMEVARCYFKYGKFINRGFLIGPYLPIYGFGALFIQLFYRELSHNFIIVFVVAILNAALLEYLTSYIMEKMFKARWWDYSKRKFNINGRICLENLIGFGILSLFILYLINPIFFKNISRIPNIIVNVFFYSFAIIILFDCLISFLVLKHVKYYTKKIRKDCSEEIHKLVVEAIKEKSWEYRRLFNAFPNLKLFKTIGRKDNKLQKNEKQKKIHK